MIQGRIDIYVSKGFKESFSQLETICNINNEKLSAKIGEAVRYYVDVLNGKPHLLADKKSWNNILKTKTKNELVEINKLISMLNQMILDKLCKN